MYYTLEKANIHKTFQTGADLQSETKKTFLTGGNFATPLQCQLASHREGNDMITKSAKPKPSNNDGLMSVQMILPTQ